jgi:hypothetical protein
MEQRWQGKGARAYRVNTAGSERGQHQMRAHPRSTASEQHVCIGVQCHCQHSKRRLGWLAGWLRSDAVAGSSQATAHPATRREGGGRRELSVRTDTSFLPPSFPSLLFSALPRPLLPSLSVPPRNREPTGVGQQAAADAAQRRKEGGRGVCVCMCVCMRVHVCSQVSVHVGRHDAPRGEGQIRR